jgi:SagB-type dehydrogenase family enzyme
MIKSPIPRQTEQAVQFDEFSLGKRHFLPNARRNTARFFDIVDERRTLYGGTPLSLAQISSLLAYVALSEKPSARRGEESVKFRPVMSAGARHPIDILVIGARGWNDHAYLYDDTLHALAELPRHPSLGAWLRDYAEQSTATSQGTLFWFLAASGRTESKYLNAESLIWRDAGALLQQFSLVATALKLTCVPLGATGEPGLSKQLRPIRGRFGAGGCYVGARKVA